MAHRIGITTDIEVAQWEIGQQFKNPRNWKSTRAFDDQKSAQDWELKKSQELGYKTVKPIKGPKTQKILWFFV